VESILDSNALVLYFPSPNSATGEDILELHVHGGPAIVKAVLKAIPSCSPTASKIRYAEPGEFTRRAFLNGRLDLTQAEALGNALDAVTEQQRRQSLRGAAGRLAKQYEDWRVLLLHARGELEALIDFSEDQHFDESPATLAASVATQVRVLRRRIAVYVENATRGELLRNGISVALLGRPNAGKSSLLNLIVGREAAIVSREAGTTRDVVEVSVDLGGYLCRFSDTAGLRSAAAAHPNSQAEPIGFVEQEGIARAKKRALESDVVVVLVSLERDGSRRVHLVLDQDVVETAGQCAEQGASIIIAINKSDLTSDIPAADAVRPAMEKLQNRLVPENGPIPLVEISCKTAADPAILDASNGGIKPLLSALTSTFAKMTCALHPDLPADTDATSPGQPLYMDTSPWQESLGASQRQRLLLQDCAGQLDAFLAQVSSASGGDDMDVVVAAESLRRAAECLARITGRGDAGDVEEVLGVVFEK
jgi:tRNA modification GTPase